MNVFAIIFKVVKFLRSLVHASVNSSCHFETREHFICIKHGNIYDKAKYIVYNRENGFTEMTLADTYSREFAEFY